MKNSVSVTWVTYHPRNFPTRRGIVSLSLVEDKTILATMNCMSTANKVVMIDESVDEKAPLS